MYCPISSNNPSEKFRLEVSTPESTNELMGDAGTGADQEPVSAVCCLKFEHRVVPTSVASWILRARQVSPPASIPYYVRLKSSYGKRFPWQPSRLQACSRSWDLGLPRSRSAPMGDLGVAKGTLSACILANEQSVVPPLQSS